MTERYGASYGESYADSYGTYRENGVNQGNYYRNDANQSGYYRENDTGQAYYGGNGAGQGTYYRNNADQRAYYGNDMNQGAYYNGNGTGYGGQYEDPGEDLGGSRSEEYEGTLEASYEEDQGMDHQEPAKFSAAGVLKWGAAFLILVYIVLLLIYTSGSTKPFDEVASSVEQQLDKESLVKQDAQALKRYYGLNSADYDGVMYYSAEFSISALEVLLIEVKADQQVQEVRDAIEERLESRKNTFEGYAPEQAQLIEQAQILARGRFIFLAVSPDAENYVTAFTKGL